MADPIKLPASLLDRAQAWLAGKDEGDEYQADAIAEHASATIPDDGYDVDASGDYTEQA